MRGLIEQGRLLHFRVFAPAHPDLSGVSVTGGDYNGQQLGDQLNDNALVADIVPTWAQLGEGDRKRVVQGQSVSVRVALGGRRTIKKKKAQEPHKSKEMT